MLKRWISLLLCAVLLAGCAPQPVKEQPEPPFSSAGENVAPTEPEPGLYVPGSDIEKRTDGAVREYRMEAGKCAGLIPIGGDWLLARSGETTAVTLLLGENLTPGAWTELGCAVPLEELMVLPDGRLGYYDTSRNCFAFLDNNFQEVSSVSMPASMVGRPLLSSDWGGVYYCTESSVRALDLQTGVSRTIKETPYSALRLVRRTGSILELYGEREDGSAVYLHLSAEDGKTFRSAREPITLEIQEDRYYAVLHAEGEEKLLFGEAEGAIFRLLLPEAGETALPLPEANAYITASTEDGETTLCYFDLESGKMTASVTIPGLTGLGGVTGDEEAVYLWAPDGAAGEFYLWELGKSPTEDKAVYTEPYYTAKNPDKTGLADCAAQAQELSKEYGVDIRIWKDAMALPGLEDAVTEEYQVSAYRRDLAVLKDALTRFPEGFFVEAADRTQSKELHICLLRELPEKIDGLMLWENGEAYLALAMGETLECAFYRTLSEVIDNRVLGCCTLYDDWSSLNPQDFQYDYGKPGEDRSGYLTEEARAFVDEASMSFPKEDRARIFACAMLPEMEDYFRTDTMQRKLARICQAIRRAFDLGEYEGVLPWEQYLDEA